MKQIVVDAKLAEQLVQATEPVELIDPSGRLEPKSDLSGWVPLTPEISDEELERRANANEKRFTTAEVLKHLEGLNA